MSKRTIFLVGFLIIGIVAVFAYLHLQARPKADQATIRLVGSAGGYSFYTTSSSPTNCLLSPNSCFVVHENSGKRMPVNNPMWVFPFSEAIRQAAADPGSPQSGGQFVELADDTAPATDKYPPKSFDSDSVGSIPTPCGQSCPIVPLQTNAWFGTPLYGTNGGFHALYTSTCDVNDPTQNNGYNDNYCHGGLLQHSLLSSYGSIPYPIYTNIPLTLSVTLEPQKAVYEPGEKVTLSYDLKSTGRLPGITHNMAPYTNLLSNPNEIDKNQIVLDGIMGGPQFSENNGLDAKPLACVTGNYQEGNCLDERQGLVFPIPGKVVSWTNVKVSPDPREPRKPTDPPEPLNKMYDYTWSQVISMPTRPSDHYKMATPILLSGMGAINTNTMIPWYSGAFAIAAPKLDLKQTGFWRPDADHTGAEVTASVTFAAESSHPVRDLLIESEPPSPDIQFSVNGGPLQSQATLSLTNGQLAKINVDLDTAGGGQIKMTDVATGTSVTRTIGFPVLKFEDVLYDGASVPQQAASLFNAARAQADTGTTETGLQVPLAVDKEFLNFLNDPNTPPDLLTSLTLAVKPTLSPVAGDTMQTTLELSAKNAGGQSIPTNLGRLAGTGALYNGSTNTLSWQIQANAAVGGPVAATTPDDEAKILISDIKGWVPDSVQKIGAAGFALYKLKVAVRDVRLDTNLVLGTNANTHVVYQPKSKTLAIHYTYHAGDSLNASLSMIQSGHGQPAFQLNLRAGSGAAVDPKQANATSFQTFIVNKDAMRLMYNSDQQVAQAFPTQLKLTFIPDVGPTIIPLQVVHRGGSPLGEPYAGQLSPGDILNGTIHSPIGSIDKNFSLAIDPTVDPSKLNQVVLTGRTTEANTAVQSSGPTVTIPLGVSPVASTYLQTNTTPSPSTNPVATNPSDSGPPSQDSPPPPSPTERLQSATTKTDAAKAYSDRKNELQSSYKQSVTTINQTKNQTLQDAGKNKMAQKTAKNQATKDLAAAKRQLNSALAAAQKLYTQKTKQITALEKAAKKKK